MNMNCVLFVSSDRILLCSLSWSQTHDPLASASLELGYSSTMPLARNCFHLQEKKKSTEIRTTLSVFRQRDRQFKLTEPRVGGGGV